ncbi:hypothetical protein QWA68_015697, partial [Fusarium oxysporum]
MDLRTPSRFLSKLQALDILLGIVVFLCLTGLATAIYRAFLHPLSRIPGPKLYAASSLFYLAYLVTGRWPFKLKELHDKYGPVVRFAPNDVSFISASAWREIYGHKKPGELPYEKDQRIYRGSLTGAPNILVADGPSHARMRRLLSHAFSERALKGQEHVVQYYLDTFIKRLKEHSAQGLPVDVVKWYNFTTFDVLGDLAFGESFGCLEAGGYHPWVAMIFDGFELATYLQALKRLPNQLSWCLSWLLPKHLIANKTRHFRMSFEKAQRRMASGNTDRDDFMSHLLRHNDDKGMTAEEVGENSNVLIVAGSETTATLLSGTTYCLLRWPETYQKLVREIRSTFAKEEDITQTAVAELKYLLAALNEGLRMYPPIPSGLGRITPAGGRFIDYYWIPEKTVVSVPHWSAYHCAQNFRDPDSFRPERWLNDSCYAGDSKDVLQPFSHGPRNCLGLNLARAESRLILTRLLWNFDLEPEPGFESWLDQKVYLFWQKGAINVKLKHVERKLIQGN